ncbi:hypothetical protein FACS1894199_00970 [Bacteroidia bacterium]|nr:hypothetical protein FACS1894199_00970 [Bacteroidia bacterium]
MATYQIHINERQMFGKSLVTMLKSIPDLVSFEPIAAKVRVDVKPTPTLHTDLEKAFREVREMADGKKEKKTLDTFLHELRNNND